MKRHYVTLLIVFFFLSLSGAAPSEKIRLALNWKPEPQFGGFYAAQFEGFYTAEKLSVEILEGGSGTPTVQMLAFGQIDAAIVSSEEILISNDRNPKNPLMAVYASFQTNPQVLITPTARQIENLEVLLKTPGTIAAQTGLSYVQFLKNLHPKSPVRWVPYTGGIQALLKEKDFAQQGFLTSEPLLAEEKGLKVKTFLVADSGFNPYTTVLAVRKKDWDKNPEKIKSLVRAVRQGWRAYLKNPSPTNQKMAEMNKALDLPFFNKSAEAQKPLVMSEPPGLMTLQRWQTLFRQMQDLKLIQGRTPLESQFLNVE